VILNVAAALLPVLVFLVILYFMDSFKLVHYDAVAFAVGAGALAALLSVVVQEAVGGEAALTHQGLTRYVAPLSEETLKAVFIVLALRKRRLGFLVDAAIIGFAVGTGFALVENLEYLRWSRDERILMSFVRGFGPAILHGTTTCVFAILAKGLEDRHPERTLLNIALAWLAAVSIHTVYNVFLLPPLLTIIVLLVALPALVTLVFARSERATRDWVGEGLDLDVDLLNLLTSPGMGGARAGNYLRELQTRFPGPVVADMFCLLRIELELAIRAKGMLLARQAGLALPVDSALTAKLQEWRFLQTSIGKTGLLALKPLGAASVRAEWQHYMLEQEHGKATAQGWHQRLRRTLERLVRHLAP
jgi:RsiW-degrading membrane proteinase PrsW (M82 family)